MTVGQHPDTMTWEAKKKKIPKYVYEDMRTDQSFDSHWLAD